ncbi:MAG: Nudix family hydrolase [Gammaproteobacteria bacterium]|uniref:Nudix family hydrolase n=1 Tax=Limnobacter sp. TaxID=2003368 RepID=UPI001DC34B5C|nr:Nudix family hydrolase [Limnobacter sp.]MBU0783537.1 Nudix family hydrolase [Gammaproteobacteria bacterium]MBU0848631.1 Nudix family hydrolase [Gammaproteobacteria bacterium]MBU1267593.1 Nudix family hydrolase [Gammaproteobacteria bacterium]MBU1780162.1 Nudix family hydrolase [Gammaproteobacteria bacterium]MBU2087001.1 Nudix family hydrolase [Gammaproteobacteria bacterium]
MNANLKPRIDVAVAVVFNPAGQVLWGCRPEGKPYAGYWEFPGGKVEPDETVWQALVRELKEELDITATEGGPWFRIEHDYEHANVRLHLYRVWAFEGTPKPLEQQAFMWSSLVGNPGLFPILPATEPLLPKLAQPALMALSNYEAGFDACANRLEQALRRMESRVYVQFREKNLKGEALLRAFEHCNALCQKTGQAMLLNSSTWLHLQGHLEELPCPLHLTEAHLLSGQFKELLCVGASVHNTSSLAVAFERGLDYAVLGAVKETASHPERAAIGWKKFHDMALEARLPVYAIGGLGNADLHEARLHGAHGVAMLSRFRA